MYCVQFLVTAFFLILNSLTDLTDLDLTVPLHNVGLYVFAMAQSALIAAQNFKLRLLCLFFFFVILLSCLACLSLSYLSLPFTCCLFFPFLASYHSVG